MTTATDKRVFTDSEWSAKVGELIVRLDNQLGELKRTKAKLDDFRLLLVRAKDQVSPDLRDEITEALAIPLDRDALLAAQKRLCAEEGYPHFAPSTGICRCGADIVDEGWATSHVTGCRVCHRSFCD